MTDIYYDTEFLEDGKTIELISIGMFDGERTLYAVNEEIVSDENLYRRICHNHWLMRNVVPHLPLRKGQEGKPLYRTEGQGSGPFFSLDLNSNDIMPLRMIRNSVREFVLSNPNPRLWAWYGAYDHVALCQLFGRMMNLPEGFPMFTCDVRQEFERFGNPTGPDRKGQSEHDALVDAIDCSDKHFWLKQQANRGSLTPLW